MHARIDKQIQLNTKQTAPGLTATEKNIQTTYNNSSLFTAIKKQNSQEKKSPAFGLEDSNDYK